DFDESEPFQRWGGGPPTHSLFAFVDARRGGPSDSRPRRTSREWHDTAVDAPQLGRRRRRNQPLDAAHVGARSIARSLLTDWRKRRRLVAGAGFEPATFGL